MILFKSLHVDEICDYNEVEEKIESDLTKDMKIDRTDNEMLILSDAVVSL